MVTKSGEVSYTASEDCYAVFLTSPYSSSCEMYINEQLVGIDYGYSQGSASYPINKNDKIKITHPYDVKGSCWIKFYHYK